MAKTQTFKVVLSGIRPLMFDRYAGDNNTQLPPEEKMYLDANRRLILPSINLYSLLAAENTSSVTKTFFGSKQWRTIAMGIKAYTTITPFDIPIFDENGPIVFTGWNDKIKAVKHVARLAKGVPNQKHRPVIETPWRVEFNIEYQSNSYCTFENLRQAFTWGGTMGLGTFRPYYGRYELTEWIDA